MISIVFEMFDDLCLNASLIMLPCDHDYRKKYTRGGRTFVKSSAIHTPNAYEVICRIARMAE
jgi:hypothetical protein